jgi:hypothetical protein
MSTTTAASRSATSTTTGWPAPRVRLLQDDEPPVDPYQPVFDRYQPVCEWMPYQKGQAAKVDALMSPAPPAPAPPPYMR